jgi:putative intracellular protease/amidase
MSQKQRWHQIDQLRKKRDFTHVETIKKEVTDDNPMVRESAWDYLREAKYFTGELVSQARLEVDLAKCPSRCSKAAAQDYISASEEKL